MSVIMHTYVVNRNSFYHNRFRDNKRRFNLNDINEFAYNVRNKNKPLSYNVYVLYSLKILKF